MCWSATRRKAALIAACQSRQAETPPVAGSPADSALQARYEEGHRAYVTNCAMCHGEWGMSDGPIAPQLAKEASAVPARLNDPARLQTLGRDELVRVIREGGAHTGRSNLMPGWSEKLPDEEIERIADFILQLPEFHREIPPQTMTRYLEAPPGAPAEGRRLFVTMCTACHGPEGRGDGRYADTLYARNGIRPRALTDSAHFAGRTDQEIFATISHGGGFFHKSKFMPVWSVTLTPDQINHLVSYVRAVSRTTSH
jgi:mono/diheme cytochrome c family protein